MEGRVLVTGGAGYLGLHTVDALLEGGFGVTVLDSLRHGQDDIAGALEDRGVRVLRADIRDEAARRSALADADATVHLAAIVGDPACAREPELSQAVNVDATRALVAEARSAGVERFVFASTCSNYGRMSDPTIPLDEHARLAPVSRYAEQKVAVERMLVDGAPSGLAQTCLRFATLYGVAPRMRFDLTVNEFTRNLWADRELEVFGEQFWRPYVHVRDAARAIRAVLEAPRGVVAGEVFNVGDSDENYRKLDLVRIVREQTDRGRVTFVHRDEDPRDYKVAFGKIARELGFATTLAVPDGVAEVIAALDSGTIPDPFAARHRNIP
jgi:nucleoside-diphosphate-sugar epimerase